MRCGPNAETDLGRPTDEFVDAAVRQRRDDRPRVGRRGDYPVGFEAAGQFAHEEHHCELQMSHF